MGRYPPCPKVTVDAVWLARGRALLVRRGNPPFRGAWALPGGFVEAGESISEAVARELREETGLAARPVALVGVYSDPRRDPRGPTVGLAVQMRGRPGRPRGGDDAAEARWWPLEALPPLAFDHATILADAVGAAGLKRPRFRPSGSRGSTPGGARGARRRRPPKGGSALR